MVKCSVYFQIKTPNKNMTATEINYIWSLNLQLCDHSHSEKLKCWSVLVKNTSHGTTIQWTLLKCHVTLLCQGDCEL